jgi:signal recognition particle subunit SRP54
MLEKLSETLTKGIKKISNAIFVDKKLIDEIIKDLQRSLIEADVNVELVFKLSQKIREIAIDENVKGIEKKEQLVKLIHDQIAILIGKGKELKLEKKEKILLLGLYGSGKCVHKDTKIQLSTGELIKAEKLYSLHSSSIKEQEIEDGKIIDISSQNLFVPSFNPTTGKIENKLATHLWKLNKKELFEVKLDNGNDFTIKVTPEHPFFILKDGKIKEIRADKLSENDFIALPENVEIKGSPQYIINKIKNLDLDIFLTREEIKELTKNKQIKKIQKDLICKRNYCNLTTALKNGQIPIELADLSKFNNIKIKFKNAEKAINLPLVINSDFAEFLGYLMGDGHIGKNYIQIVNEDKEIIERIILLSKQLFNISPEVKRDLRTNKMYSIRLSSKTLIEILKVFNLNPGKKGINLEIPVEILKSNNEVIRNFIKAYFDCDGSPSKNSRQIELTSESKPLIYQMSSLLRRFSILSSISSKEVKGKNYSRLTISGRPSEKFAEKIGSAIKHKQKNLKKFELYGKIQGNGRGDMIPLGIYLKKIRELGGFSIGEIQNYVYSYGRYEQFGFISREKLIQLIIFYESKKIGIFSQILNKLNNNEKINYRVFNGILSHLKKSNFINENLTLSSIGQQYILSVSQESFLQELNNLKMLAFSDVKWTNVSNVKKIENDSPYVYDLTVEDNHSFIADNFIVHNTTSISKLAFYYAKRGKKVCALGLDTQRPAAMTQLETMCKKANVPAFIDVSEKDPAKIIKKYEKELEDYDIVFIDTAGRDGLNKDLITEIKSIEKKVKPTYRILVIPADIGQAAKTQAQEFQKALSIDGVIITRMDGTAKAGGAITACAETNAPVFFIGTGEKIHEFEVFNPTSFISRLLGMGDLEGLLEKVRSAVDDKQQAKIEERLKEGKFNLNDLYSQLESMGQMGSMDKIMSMIPGFGNAAAKVPKEAMQKQEEKMKRWKYAIQSMTKEEVENPELFDKQTSRIQRVSRGSGTTTSEIRELLKQYKMINDLMKSQSSMQGLQEGKIDKKTMMKFARQFKGKIKM